MRTRLVYLRLELKRAWKRFPHMMAGAIALLLLVGAAALLSARALYGERAVGRVAVGVILPEGDGLARQAVSMLSSLDSVESLCDFKYMDREEALRQLEKGQVYAVMEVPPQFVEDIINGKIRLYRLFCLKAEAWKAEFSWSSQRLGQLLWKPARQGFMQGINCLKFILWNVLFLS